MSWDGLNRAGSPSPVMSMVCCARAAGAAVSSAAVMLTVSSAEPDSSWRSGLIMDDSLCCWSDVRLLVHRYHSSIISARAKIHA